MTKTPKSIRADLIKYGEALIEALGDPESTMSDIDEATDNLAFAIDAAKGE